MRAHTAPPPRPRGQVWRCPTSCRSAQGRMQATSSERLRSITRSSPRLLGSAAVPHAPSGRPRRTCAPRSWARWLHRPARRAPCHAATRRALERGLRAWRITRQHLTRGTALSPSLISEVSLWGGFAPEAVSYLRGLAQARSDRLDIEQESTTWTTRSFTSYYGQRLSVALTMGVAHE